MIPLAAARSKLRSRGSSTKPFVATHDLSINWTHSGRLNCEDYHRFRSAPFWELRCRCVTQFVLTSPIDVRRKQSVVTIPDFNRVPPRKKGGLNFQAPDEFKKEHGIDAVVIYIADDFDAPLPEDFLLRPME